MDDFARKLITKWRTIESLPENGHVLIAVSGGADSCAMALGFSQLKAKNKIAHQFSVAHFNHRLRGEESNRDAAFVENFAREIGFDALIGGAVKGVNPDNKDVEQTARNSRYDFLVKTAIENKCVAILTAHTKNDQAETLLLNLLRGAGLNGLAAMKVVREIGTNEFGVGLGELESKRLLLVRPLLEWAFREDTEGYLKSMGCEYCGDSMNDDSRFMRVKIRKELLPKMKELNPKIIDGLSRTAGIIRGELDLLASSSDRESTKTGTEIKYEGELTVQMIRSLSGAESTNLLRKWLEQQRGHLRSITSSHIEAIDKLARSKKSGRIAELPGLERVVKHDGMLCFLPAKGL